MKTVVSAAILLILTLSACKKNNAFSGGWQLVEKDSWMGPNTLVTTPTAMSEVMLDLKSNGIYVSTLNSATISQGTYSITVDASYYNRQVLNLHNFKTTGIFSLFTIFQVGTNGQVVSEFDGFYMDISHDTMRLSGALTPGGGVSYTFVKR